MPSVTVENQNIYYESTGTRGLPVVFVHGSGSNHAIWMPQVQGLATIARPAAVDLPGHGRSDPPGRSTVEAYAEFVVRLLDVLQFNQVVIVGHSLGGAIAQTVALAYPDRVAGLGLVGTGARLSVLPKILDGLVIDFENTAPYIVENSYGPNLSQEMRDRAMADLNACDTTVTHGDYSACNMFDVMARLGEIRAPTLVICGRQDRMTPVKYSEFLISKIPGARLVQIDDAGHSVMIEQPAATTDALVGFVSGLAV